VTIDDFHRLLGELWAATLNDEIDPEKGELAGKYLARLREYTQLVNAEAVRRRLHTGAILQFQARLMRLVREHPDPIAALSKFREHFDEADLS